MKVIVRVNEFKRVLEEARFVVIPSPTDHFIPPPVLYYVKIDVNSDKTATIARDSISMSLVQSFEVVDGSTCSFLLPTKQVHDFLKRHVDGTATIETDDKNVILKVGASTGRFSSMAVRDFPQIETMPESKYTVSLKFLKRLMTQVESACPEKPGRQSVASVKLESDGTKLRAVASDGYRIAIADALGDFGPFDFQIPKNIVPVLKRREGPKVEIAESATNFFFRTESVVVRFNKPVTTFPVCQKALNLDGFKGTVKVASKDLKSAILKLKTTHDEKAPAVTFEVSAGCLHLTSTRLDASGSDSLEVETHGEPGTFTLNPNFVLDCLSQMEGEVTIEYIDARKLVRLSAGSNYRHLIQTLIPITPPKTVPKEQSPSPATA